MGQIFVAGAIVGIVWFLGSEVVHGVKKVGHGVKVAACKVHIVHCDAPKK